MSVDFPELWHALTAQFPLGESSIHGPDHWRTVEQNGLALAETNGADRTVVRLFAVLHDARRQNDAIDPEHGRRAAELAETLHGDLFDIEPQQLEKLLYACTHHTRGTTSTDPTIGACWDADRLDLPRIGTNPKPEYMSTEEGRRRAGQG